MENKTVSIIIPTSNCCDFLKRAVDSIKCQTYQNLEIIVVDNNSIDDTKKYIQSTTDERIKYISINNYGIIAKSRNIGIENARGQYIAFLDADDWWKKDKIEKSLKYHQEGYLFTYHDLDVQTNSKKNIINKKIFSRKLTYPITIDLFENGNGIPNSSVIIDINLIKKIGGLSENPLLVGAEDYECWLRVSKETSKFYRIPESLGYYWIGNSNTSNPTRSIMWLNEIKKNKKIYIENTEDKSTPYWMTFALCKNYYILENYILAIKYGKKLIKEKISIWLKIKTYYILIISKLKINAFITS
jgi:glycosyltransferase involved in cell wall biosynthesis